LYGSETWTLRKEDIKNLEAFEMRMWSSMERISWMEHRTNEEILQIVDENNERGLPTKNYNRGKNGREKEKRKAENGVTGLDDERGLQQVEGESWTSC